MFEFDPDRIRERLSEVGEDWADKDAAASLLEETKKTLLAELMVGLDGSKTDREMKALADPTYRLHITNMVTARKEANRARVRYETGKMWAELKRSQESTRRAEANIR